MDNVKIFFSTLFILIVGVVALAIFRSNSTPSIVADGEYDTFAQCIADSGATFYGAFWCPHCQAQKKMFGSAAKLLPYVECSTLDGKGQNQICTDKKVEGYPTWEFADGSRMSGEVSLQNLSLKTSCTLPASATGLPEVESGASSPAVE